MIEHRHFVSRILVEPRLRAVCFGVLILLVSTGFYLVGNSPTAQAREPQRVAPAPFKLPALTPAQTPYLVAAGRSPLPQTGESIRKPLPFIRLVPEPEPLPAPEGVVGWNEAHQYVGQTIAVEGQIVNTRNLGSVCFLNFTTNWQTAFYVVIFKDAFPDFPQAPEAYFLNQRIEVQGEVSLHKGRPQIQVHKASQIKIVSGK